MKAQTLSVFACAVLLGGCAADQQRVVARSGATTPVGFIATMTVTCNDMAPPRPEIAAPPRAGKVTFGVTTTRLNNPQSQCNGQSMTGSYAAYTPNRGFRGEDRFTVRYVYDSDDGGGTANRAVEYIVDVK